jgi:hypothetical protein
MSANRLMEVGIRLNGMWPLRDRHKDMGLGKLLYIGVNVRKKYMFSLEDRKRLLRKHSNELKSR